MLSIEDIWEAAERIDSVVHATPVVQCEAIDDRCQANVLLKCENLQKVGAFKARGASNAILSLSDKQAQRGVVTHSSGNHAQAVAFAARSRGIPAYIVMPRDSPSVKRRAVEGYGGQITLCEPTQAAREKACAEIQKRTSAALIHPYAEERVMAGQGTVGLELMAQVEDLHAVLVPVSGGGLVSGIATAIKALRPEVAVIGVEPAGADDATRSWTTGELQGNTKPQTIADGLRANLGELNFEILQERVDDMWTVKEESIVEAMRWIFQRAKMVVEPSGAVALAGLMEHGVVRLQFEGPGRPNVGVVVSGGNIDLEPFFELLLPKVQA